MPETALDLFEIMATTRSMRRLKPDPVPADVHSYALLPIGYPMGRFGPARRVPVADIVYEDRWDQPYQDQ